MDQRGRYDKPRKIIDQPYHLSYPFLFEWGGSFYMIPESSANRSIQLYRCMHFPFEWQFEKNLMAGVDAVDTTLARHGGRWWMFTTIRDNEGYPNWDELFLFSADSPVSDRWVPHPLNPVVFDIRRARPAGPIFAQDGELFRPSQDCSNRYGYGLRLQRIKTLTETQYEEEEVTFVEPLWDRRITAVHSYAREVGLTVIDALYRRWRYS
jgi:hypothetical protein